MGFTQPQAAAALQRSKGTIAEYEKTPAEPIDANIETVCRVLTIARRGLIKSTDQDMTALFLDAQARLAAATAAGNAQAAASTDPAVYVFLDGSTQLHPTKRARLEPVVGGFQVSLVERGLVIERSEVKPSIALAEMFIAENVPPGYAFQPLKELPAPLRRRATLYDYSRSE